VVVFACAHVGVSFVCACGLWSVRCCISLRGCGVYENKQGGTKGRRGFVLDMCPFVESVEKG